MKFSNLKELQAEKLRLQTLRADQEYNFREHGRKLGNLFLPLKKTISGVVHVIHAGGRVRNFIKGIFHRQVKLLPAKSGL